MEMTQQSNTATTTPTSQATSNHQEPEMGPRKNESLSSCGKHAKKPGGSLHRRTESRKQRDLKLQKIKKLKDEENKKKMGVVVLSGEEFDDKAEVERKISALQRIVPGGEELGVDRLFEETAVYILELQCQVKAMRALTSFFETLDKEKRKLGG